MLFIIYLVVVLVYSYINAATCYAKDIKYPWKEDILLCVFWPVTMPIAILAIIASERTVNKDKP